MKIRQTIKTSIVKKPIQKRIRNYLFYLFLLFLIKVIRALPRMIAIRVAKGLGWMVCLCGRSLRKRIVRHLNMAFGEEKSVAEIENIARNVVLHFSIVVVDFICLPRLVQNRFDNLVQAEGVAHLDKAYKQGRGLIILTAHLGNWELLGAWLVQNGYKGKVVGATIDDPLFDKLVVDTRNQAGYTNIKRGVATREILRTIKKGEAVGMLIDLDTIAQATFVNFFGMATWTPVGPVILARKLSIPVVPVMIYLEDNYTYRVVCEPPIDFVHTEDIEKDLVVNVQKCSDIYERYIRQHPEQWTWMHKRWMTRPKGGQRK